MATASTPENPNAFSQSYKQQDIFQKKALIS
jgi:hypothetical protein